MNQYDKHAQVSGMEYLPIALANIVNIPGATHISVTGTWTKVPISSAEFKETDEPGELIEQQLKAIITDINKALLYEMQNLFAQEGVVRIIYTNGDVKVVGTDEFPVLIKAVVGGDPVAISLSFKRNSPEKAKYLQSF